MKRLVKTSFFIEYFCFLFYNLSMRRIVNVLKEDNISCGYLYFYIHFVVEVVCFFFLSRISNSLIVWMVPLLYDAFAFVPQSIIGYISDKYPKIKMGIIGVVLLFIGILIFSFLSVSKYIPLFIICFGNCFLHISGAENTLKNSHGKLAHSAIFVSGGSFGVISGRLLAKTMIPAWLLLPFILTMIPFIIYADTFTNSKSNCKEFNYVKPKLNYGLVILIAVFVVIIRGYMGYGIPTSWNKTVIQNVMLFCFMGVGKALGGILSDAFGIRKVAILSTIFAIPFLCFGDSIMVVSLIGVMSFSMTMSITLGILVSTLKKTPGLAFGLTTIGLFLGTLPIFFIRTPNILYNSIMIAILSVMCSLALGYVLKKEDKHV